MLLKNENLNKALEILAGAAKVLVPTTVDDVKKFVPYEAGVQPDFAMVNTTLPPKDALFPQTERMFRFRVGGSAVEEIVEMQQQIVFGIRPCDVHSIDCMDQVFLTKTFVDPFYQRKRDNLTIVAVTCAKAERTCFCQSMGVDPGQAPLADVVLRPTGDGYAVSAQTDRGKTLVESLSPVLTNGEGTPLPKAELTLAPDMDGVPEKLRGLFESEMWSELTRACLGCGTCTFVCPTCYCFEIGAEMQGGEGTQIRCWDSCMFSEYSRMAGGHNPRPTKRERLRNRYMHKLAFFEERYGRNLCVGCGRCIDKCPVSLDITRVIDKVKEVAYAAVN